MFNSKDSNNKKEEVKMEYSNYELKLDGTQTSAKFITKISDIVIDSCNQSNTNMNLTKNPYPGMIISLVSEGVRLSNVGTNCENYVSEVKEVAEMNDVNAKDVYDQFVNNCHRKMFLDIGLKTVAPMFATIAIRSFTENKKDTPITYALKCANLPRLVGFGAAELIDKQLIKNDIKKFEKSGEEGKKIGALYYGNKLGDTQYSKDSKFVTKGKVVGSLLDATVMSSIGYISQKNSNKINSPIPKLVGPFDVTVNDKGSDTFIVIEKVEDKASPAKSSDKPVTNNTSKSKK